MAKEFIAAAKEIIAVYGWGEKPDVGVPARPLYKNVMTLYNFTPLYTWLNVAQSGCDGRIVCFGMLQKLLYTTPPISDIGKVRGRMFQTNTFFEANRHRIG